MDTNMYTSFRDWLIRTKRIDLNPDAVSYVWGINRYLRKRSDSYDLFSVIRTKSFSILYTMRNDKRFIRSRRNNEQFEGTIKLCFEYLECPFEEYEQYEAEHIFKVYSEQKVLLIHQGKIACIRYNHPIKDISAQIATYASDPIRIHASYCSRCHIAFIHNAYYQRLRKQNRFIVANFFELSDDGYTGLVKTSMAAESPLRLCGYSVKANFLSDDQRKCLLHNIIYNGILTKVNIIQYLEHFIDFNGGKENMFDAVKCWGSDLDYVRNLNIESQPIVEITEIRSYRNR